MGEKLRRRHRQDGAIGNERASERQPIFQSGQCADDRDGRRTCSRSGSDSSRLVSVTTAVRVAVGDGRVGVSLLTARVTLVGRP